MATTEFISRPPLSRIKWTDAVLWRKRHKQFDRIQPTFQGMEPNHPTLSALIKLHADLGGQIFENRKRAEKLAEDMKHVEAVIRMFAPSFDVRKISMKRVGFDKGAGSCAAAEPVEHKRSSQQEKPDGVNYFF